MKRIGILSDTHGTVPRQAYSFFSNCDEIWHAGDLGRGVLELLRAFKPLRAVYGNIDDGALHYELPASQLFECEGLRVFLTHIGGWPGHYPSHIRKILEHDKPDIFVCGHSHILKIMYDRQLNLLHINPGAAGRVGFHKVSTLVRFVIDGSPRDMEIMEMDKFSSPDSPTA